MSMLVIQIFVVVVLLDEIWKYLGCALVMKGIYFYFFAKFTFLFPALVWELVHLQPFLYDLRLFGAPAPTASVQINKTLLLYWIFIALSPSAEVSNP